VLVTPVPLYEALQSIAPLNTDRIDVWAASVEKFAPLPPSLLQSLSADEIARGQHFVFEADRQRYRVARALLRRILGAYLGTAPSSLRFSNAIHGKPVLEDGRLDFNLSHSGDRILIAVTRGQPVGVDVEQMKIGGDLRELAESCFSVSERKVVFADKAGERARFYEYWACKEAWMKADGRGLGLPLTEFSLVGIEPAGCYRVDPADPREWRIQSLPFDGYGAAVAAPAGAWSARLIHIT
jgi:4'-phosphopantetheinyl transferase